MTTSGFVEYNRRISIWKEALGIFWAQDCFLEGGVDICFSLGLIPLHLLRFMAIERSILICSCTMICTFATRAPQNPWYNQTRTTQPRSVNQQVGPRISSAMLTAKFDSVQLTLIGSNFLIQSKHRDPSISHRLGPCKLARGQPG